jgi:hypothetical protein|tara:strand:+ start:2487 stop:3080 length:594 start_codon:yes stop_codon:yes gene_type:complete
MKNTMRFNPPKDWFSGGNMNPLLVGMMNMIGTAAGIIQGTDGTIKVLEIGSFMGESTFMLGAMGCFDEIHCIEPFSGDISEYKYLSPNDGWKGVKREFWTNTRLFKDKVHLYQDFSYNMADKFENESFDMVYIDAKHDYESVKLDLELYLPKVKIGAVIAGHDYSKTFPGVQRAVNEICGSPESVFMDNSWLTRRKT